MDDGHNNKGVLLMVFFQVYPATSLVCLPIERFPRVNRHYKASLIACFYARSLFEEGLCDT